MAETLSETGPFERCPGCGLRRPVVDGPVDPYGGASASCWAAFNEILAGDFAEWQPMRHRLTVDAYMAQHPCSDTPSGRRSVLTHLVGLCAALERELPSQSIGRLLGSVFPDKSDREVPALHPVPDLTESTVEHLLSATGADDYDRRTLAWATSVWRAWNEHHAVVRALADEASDRSVRPAPRHPRRSR